MRKTVNGSIQDGIEIDRNWGSIWVSVPHNFFDFVDDFGSKNNYIFYKIEVYQPKLT